ncbi:GIN domain-containing protein [Sphingomonas sp. CJ99]
MRTALLLALSLPLLPAAASHAVAAPQAGGPVLERRVVLSGFDRLRVDGPWRVEVSTGTSPGAVVTGTRQAMETVQVRQEGGVLIVSPMRDARGGWPDDALSGDGPVIRVTVPTLDGATVIGAGSVAIDRIGGARVQLVVNGPGTMAVGAVEADQLQATVIGTGRITMAGTARSARILSNGGGSIGGFPLVADEARVRSESSGTIELTARYRADVSGLGLGSVTIGGNPECRVTGPAPIRCGKGGER